MAVWLRQAGLKVLSGTLPVEARWAQLEDMFPRSTRLISYKWFCVLSDLSYMRVVYRHFHAKMLPPWAEDDALMAERLDTLSAIVRDVSEGEGGVSGPSSLLFEPFL